MTGLETGWDTVARATRGVKLGLTLATLVLGAFLTVGAKLPGASRSAPPDACGAPEVAAGFTGFGAGLAIATGAAGPGPGTDRTVLGAEGPVPSTEGPVLGVRVQGRPPGTDGTAPPPRLPMTGAP
jgi:hypothetical protein